MYALAAFNVRPKCLPHCILFVFRTLSQKMVSSLIENPGYENGEILLKAKAKK